MLEIRDNCRHEYKVLHAARNAPTNDGKRTFQLYRHILRRLRQSTFRKTRFQAVPLIFSQVLEIWYKRSSLERRTNVSEYYNLLELIETSAKCRRYFRGKCIV